MVIYVDIDETICEYGNVREYSKALPIIERIEKINKLKEEGNTIVYWTARGSTTGIDWTDLTKNQLSEWGANYDQLKMAKPHYDLFICDKAINSERYFEIQ
tara:strand:+ start:1560 stop:1862 length:303 start_codon:yes stop_codon:yes gene_type:complete